MATLKATKKELSYYTLEGILNRFTQVLDEQQSENIYEYYTIDNEDNGILYFDISGVNCLNNFFEMGYNLKEIHDRFLYRGGDEMSILKDQDGFCYIVYGGEFDFDILINS